MILKLKFFIYRTYSDRYSINFSNNTKRCSSGVGKFLVSAVSGKELAVFFILFLLVVKLVHTFQSYLGHGQILPGILVKTGLFSTYSISKSNFSHGFMTIFLFPVRLISKIFFTSTFILLSFFANCLLVVEI
jgi:hypothetical protein